MFMNFFNLHYKYQRNKNYGNLLLLSVCLQEERDEHGEWEGKQEGKSDKQEDHGIQRTAKGKHHSVHKPSKYPFIKMSI
jgi:hypothetical protein